MLGFFKEFFKVILPCKPNTSDQNYLRLTRVSFQSPIDIKIKGETVRIQPKYQWTSSKLKVSDLKDVSVITDHFYVNVK